MHPTPVQGAVQRMCQILLTMCGVCCVCLHRSHRAGSRGSLQQVRPARGKQSTVLATTSLPCALCCSWHAGLSVMQQKRVSTGAGKPLTAAAAAAASAANINHKHLPVLL